MRCLRSFLLITLLLPLAALPAQAQGQTFGERSRTQVPALFTGDGPREVKLPALDPRALRLDDEERVAKGKEPHFAAVHEVDIDPYRYGRWRLIGNDRVRWRFRLSSPGALSLSVAFSELHLPRGARLVISTPEQTLGPFRHRDNDPHGQLWTLPLNGDTLDFRLTLPAKSFDQLRMQMSRAHHGYAGFGEATADKSGACQRDVACVDDGAWQSEARSVGLVAVEGVRYCTGFLVNNTAQDRKPLLVTARHCGIDASNASSVVVRWGHRRQQCDLPNATVRRPPFQTGAALRATDARTDMLLLELDDPAPDGAFFAGWDRSDDDPLHTVAIHHPNTDRQRIAVDRQPARKTGYRRDIEVRGGNHLRVGAWEIGTTEGGSSGAPLFDQNRRVVGVLHGGYAACGVPRADWFGRLAVAWDEGSSPATRLREWLDPIDSQALVLDGLDSQALDSRKLGVRSP